MNEDILLKAIEKCLNVASTPEQKRLFSWAKSAVLAPNIDELRRQVICAGDGFGKITNKAVDKAIDAVNANIDFKIERSDDSDKRKSLQKNAMILYTEDLKIKMKDILSSLGWLEIAIE
jgi:hypothetical protein